MKVNVLIVVKDDAVQIRKTLESIRGLGRIFVLDNLSTDNTSDVAREFGATVFSKNGSNLGKLKNYLIEKAPEGWVLFLDSDEVISATLHKEIRELLRQNRVRYKAYRISYQNHVFSHPVYHGGENYEKVRLFVKGFAQVQSFRLHEEIIPSTSVGKLKGKIYHYSYRNPWQLFSKFTRYALINSELIDKQGEVITFKKLFAYGPHMFLSRFIHDKGYKDYFYGFIIALAFAYMEQMTYIALLFRKGFSR